jgi:hypothetical protein
MSKQKRKGDDYERELASYINDKVGISCFRAPLSGGGKVGMVGGTDILGAPELFIEAKRVERLNFHDALRQAEGNIGKTASQDRAVVINRRSREPTGRSLVLLRLDDFLDLYRGYLVRHGVVETD